MALSNETGDYENLKSIITYNTTLVLFYKIAKLFSYSKAPTQG